MLGPRMLHGLEADSFPRRRDISLPRRPWSMLVSSLANTRPSACRDGRDIGNVGHSRLVGRGPLERARQDVGRDRERVPRVRRDPESPSTLRRQAPARLPARSGFRRLAVARLHPRRDHEPAADPDHWGPANALDADPRLRPLECAVSGLPPGFTGEAGRPRRRPAAPAKMALIVPIRSSAATASRAGGGDGTSDAAS